MVSRSSKSRGGEIDRKFREPTVETHNMGSALALDRPVSVAIGLCPHKFQISSDAYHSSWKPL